jgi:hypothetical protein
MTKFDYKKDLKQLYFPPAKIFTFVEVPPMNFLMIDGHGDPNKVPAYQEALEALYTMAYTIKFALKPRGIEYVIPPSEGLWWMEDMRQFSQETKDRWDWTMMIMQPQDVSAEVVEQARGSATRKKELPALNKLRFERFHEGLCVQIMYFGAYADEGPTIASMHAFIHEQGYELTGKHHEIYLGDHRRTPPEKLKTVIRQPVKIMA